MKKIILTIVVLIIVFGGYIFFQLQKDDGKELTDNQKKAVHIAKMPLSYPVTIIKVEELECFGCFEIIFQRDDNQNWFTVMLRDWKHYWGSHNSQNDNSSFSFGNPVLPENIISEKDCIAAGGEIWNMLGEKISYEGELVGRIEGLNCPCACLVKKD